ncbi:MAG: CZB domain-containing protein [Nitrospirae bacterium]|nr:CZB domain-containing protein [Nitrospirota bacterium]
MQRISIELGAQLLVDFGKTVTRVKCELIGMNVGKYLIVIVNETSANVNLHNMIFKGNQITARYMYKGVVYGFKSSITYITFNPDKLIFIAYPNRVEEKNVRGLQRVECNFPASVVFGDKEYNGIVVDISKAGCKFSVLINDETGKVKMDEFAAKSTAFSDAIRLNLQLPGVSNNLSFICKLRNLNSSEQHSILGLEFKEMTAEDVLVLYDYLFKVDALPKTFNFELVKTKHIVWVNKIKKSLKADTDIAQKDMLTSRHCEFGKWLYSEGLKQFAHLEDMPKIEKVHEELHNLVFEIKKANLSIKQRQESIVAIDKISNELIKLLNNIESLINTKVEGAS